MNLARSAGILCARAALQQRVRARSATLQSSRCTRFLTPLALQLHCALISVPEFFYFTLLFLIPSSETDVQCGAGHVDIKVELQEAGHGAAAHKACGLRT